MRAADAASASAQAAAGPKVVERQWLRVHVDLSLADSLTDDENPLVRCVCSSGRLLLTIPRTPRSGMCCRAPHPLSGREHLLKGGRFLKVAGPALQRPNVFCANFIPPSSAGIELLLRTWHKPHQCCYCCRNAICTCHCPNQVHRRPDGASVIPPSCSEHVDKCGKAAAALPRSVISLLTIIEGTPLQAHSGALHGDP